MQVVVAALVLLAGADPAPGELPPPPAKILPPVALGRPIVPIEVDRKKLRRSIQLPRISLKQSIALTSQGKVLLPDFNVSLAPEITAGEKSLRGDAEDARRYRILSDLYYRAGDEAKGDAARAKAANLYRIQRLARPRDGLLLAHYADCLETEHPRQRDEVEALLRQAVQLAPAEWECWVFLGCLLEQKGNDVLAGQESGIDANLPATLERRTREGKSAAEATRQSEDCFTEARRCYDRAVVVAPREPKVYLARANFRKNRASNGIMRKIEPGETVDALPDIPPAECCADLWQAAALNPDDCATVGVAALYELARSLGASNTGAFDAIPQRNQSRVAVQGAIVQLEKLAAGREQFAAARAAAVLALLHLLSKDFRKMEESATRAVRLNPNLDHAWDMRDCALCLQHKARELLASSQERVAFLDSPRNRFLLAKACEEADRPAEAVQVLEIALQRNSEHFLCNLALAALLMRPDDRDLERAGQLLNRAAQAMRKPLVEEEVMAFVILGITHMALEGHVDMARERLRKISPDRREDPQIQNLLKLLDGPAIPSPPAGFPHGGQGN